MTLTPQIGIIIDAYIARLTEFMREPQDEFLLFEVINSCPVKDEVAILISQLPPEGRAKIMLSKELVRRKIILLFRTKLAAVIGRKHPTDGTAQDEEDALGNQLEDLKVAEDLNEESVSDWYDEDDLRHTIVKNEVTSASTSEKSTDVADGVTTESTVSAITSVDAPNLEELAAIKAELASAKMENEAMRSIIKHLEDLPIGWNVEWSRRFQRVYYMNPLLGLSVWENPDKVAP